MVQRLERVFLHFGHDEGAKARQVLLEEIDHASGQPLATEADALVPLTQVQAARANVARLLEQRDARLGPEPAAEEKGRVGAHGESWRQDELRDVVVMVEALRFGDLQVHLEARVARLDHHRVVPHRQLVDASDGEVEGVAASRVHRSVQHLVARLRHHVVEAQIRLAQGREDAGQDGGEVERSGGGAHLGVEPVELRLHRRDPPAREGLRVRVGLQIEEAELGREVRILDVLQDAQGPAGWVIGPVDEEELLLRPDAEDAALEPLLLHHPLECAELGQEGAHEAPPRVSTEVLVDLLVRHGRRHLLSLP